MLITYNSFISWRKAARARELIDAGVPVAISTDCNPGSSPTISMPLVMNLACIMMKMTPAESLCAATYNAACALQIEDRVGSIEVGKQADLVLWDVHNHQKLHYIFGVNHVKKSLEKRCKGGRLICLFNQNVNGSRKKVQLCINGLSKRRIRIQMT